MLMTLLSSRGNINFVDLIFIFLSYAMVILLALPVHELSHGLMAYKLGDNTAKWNGRLTLNPFAHLDVIGTLMIFLVGFGYAKPVPVNPRNFRNYKSGMLLTSLAGPLSNFVMAVLSMGILRILLLVLPTNIIAFFISLFFTQFARINLGLAVFNLLPIPPLDGFRIFANVLPARWSYFVDRNQMYITMALMVLIFSGFLNAPLAFLTNGLYGFIKLIFGMTTILSAFGLY